MVLQYREYIPTCIERNYGSLVPKHLKARCFVPYNTQINEPFNDNMHIPAPNVLMNLAMTKNPDRFCQPCCGDKDKKQKQEVKCCGQAKNDCCNPTPCPKSPKNQHQNRSHLPLSDSPSDSDSSDNDDDDDVRGGKKTRRSSFANKSVTSTSTRTSVSKKSMTKSYKENQRMKTTAGYKEVNSNPMGYPVTSYPCGPPMYGPMGPYPPPFFGPMPPQYQPNFSGPPMTSGKVLGLMHYDKDHPNCGPYITTTTGQRIYAQRRENQCGTAYVWPQGILEEMIYTPPVNQDVSCYANIVKYDNVILEAETSSSEQPSDYSSSVKSYLEPSFQQERSPTPDQSPNANIIKNQWVQVDSRPVVKGTGSRFEASRTDSFEINCAFIQDCAVSSTDEFSQNTCSSLEWIDHETGNVVNNHSIGLQYSENENGKDKDSIKIDRQISTSSLLKSQVIYGTPLLESNTKSIQVGCQATNEIGTSPNPIPLKINSLVQVDINKAMLDVSRFVPLDANKDVYTEYNNSVSTHHTMNQRSHYLSKHHQPLVSQGRMESSLSKITSLSSSRSDSAVENANDERRFLTKRQIGASPDLHNLHNRRSRPIATPQQSKSCRERWVFSKFSSRLPENHHQSAFNSVSPLDNVRFSQLFNSSNEPLFSTNSKNPLERIWDDSTNHQRRSESYINTVEQNLLDDSQAKKFMNKKVNKLGKDFQEKTNQRRSKHRKVHISDSYQGAYSDIRNQIKTEQKVVASPLSCVKCKKGKKKRASFLDTETKCANQSKMYRKRISFQEGDFENSQHRFPSESTRLPASQNYTHTENFQAWQMPLCSPAKIYYQPLDTSQEGILSKWRETPYHDQLLPKQSDRVLSEAAPKRKHRSKRKKDKKQMFSIARHSECNVDGLQSTNKDFRGRTDSILVSDRGTTQDLSKFKIAESVPDLLPSQQDPTNFNCVLISDSLVESAMQFTEDPTQPSRNSVLQQGSAITNWRHSEDYSRTHSVLPVPPYAVALCPQCEHSEHKISSEVFKPCELPKRKSKKKRRWYFEGIRFAAKK